MKRALKFSLVLLSLGLLSNTGKAQSLTHSPVGASSSITMNVQAVVSNYPPLGGPPTATLQSFYFPNTPSTQNINNFSPITSVLSALTFDINLGSGIYTVYLDASEIQGLNSAPNAYVIKPLPSGVPCNLKVIGTGNNNFTFATVCY